MTLYYKRSQTELTALFCTGSTQHVTAPCDFIYIYDLLFMYTPLYKVQLYLISFIHKSNLSGFLVQWDLPHVMQKKEVTDL